MMRNPFWLAFALAVIGLFGLSLYVNPLRPGIDLAGGTSLFYEVNVPEGQNAQQAVESVIEVLKNRVDPRGVMNLVWRPQGQNRFEVQMTLATAESKERREAYLAARQELLAGNISPHDLDVALAASPATRSERLEQLAGDSESLLEDLRRAAMAYDAMEVARQVYEVAEDERNAAEQVVQSLGPDDPEEKREQVVARFEELQATLQLRAAEYLDATDAYQAVREDVLAYNISLNELASLLQQSPDAPAEGEVSPRAATMEQLIRDHPSREAEIRAVTAAYDAYEQVKGQLDDPNDLIALLRGAGVLEFRIAARPGELQSAGLLDDYRTRLAEQGPRAGAGEPYRWFVIDNPAQFVGGPSDLAEMLEDPAAWFEARGQIVDAYGEEFYILLGNTARDSITQRPEQSGWELQSARTGVDGTGFPAVNFNLNATGGSLMRQLTSTNTGREMAIVLDGRVISAPRIQSTIARSGQITGGRGGFTDEEIRYLINTLNAGSLQAQISPEPIMINTISPAAGRENLMSGFYAAIYALILVVIFMAIYYLFWGMLADFALAANMVLILGVMAAIDATFTLPGIAGIVLTIGMAVDANVLIFERIREELNKTGPDAPDLPTAVRLGYEKALSTILDANITTLITCVVLGYTATAEVKGFAVTLGIGICATLFSALFFTRTIVGQYLRWVKPKSIKAAPMLPAVVPAINRALTFNVDWVARRGVFAIVSAVLLAVGLIAIIARGGDMLDIEFRSGTQVELELADATGAPAALSREAIRDRLAAAAEAAELPALQPAPTGTATVVVTEETPEGLASAFQVQTLTSQSEAVSEALRETFADVLDTQPRVEFVGDGSGMVVQMRFVEDEAPDRDQLQAALEQEFDFNAEPVNLVVTDVIRAADLEADAQLEAEAGDVLAAELRMPRGDRIAAADRVEAALGELLIAPPRVADAPPPTVNRAPVFPVTDPRLGENIDRPSATADVGEFLGGVAIVLEDMTPATTLADIETRIRRLRLQPQHEDKSFRQFRVLGLELAEQTQPAAGDDGGDAYERALYRSAVVVSSDGTTDYRRSPEAFDAPDGLAATEWRIVVEAMHRASSLASVTNFSPQISGTMQQRAIVALTLSLLAVVVYIWLRFGSIRYGLAAIAALVHDVTIALGLVALTGFIYDNVIARALLIQPFRIDLAMVGAVLTIVGYSLNDTIVIFDRVRENRGRLSYLSVETINNSINQTLSRTLLTSGTTLLALLTLYSFGGEAVHGFGFAMIVGVLIGTYSSIAVAAPLLLVGAKRSSRYTGDAARPDAAASNAPATT